MVSVNVRYFAMLRERIGRDGEVMDLADGLDGGALIEQLAARLPHAATTLRRCRIAVDLEFAHGSLRLRDGCELALIPPVSGG